MLSTNTPAQIADDWQAEIESGLEAGQPPLLQLGATHSPLTGAVGLLALAALARRRTDIGAPAALLGGATPYWLAALLLRPSPGPLPHPQETATLYAGPDPATYAAALDAHAAPIAGPTRLVRAPYDLPDGLASHSAPAALPGAPTRWDALPWLTAVPAHHDARYDAPPPAPDWPAIAAMIAAITLVLLALLF